MKSPLAANWDYTASSAVAFYVNNRRAERCANIVYSVIFHDIISSDLLRFILLFQTYALLLSGKFPIVIARLDTSSSFANNREFSFIVLSCRSTTWVVFTKYLSGSLKPLWQSSPIPSSFKSIPPSSAICSSQRFPSPAKSTAQTFWTKRLFKSILKAQKSSCSYLLFS